MLIIKSSQIAALEVSAANDLARELAIDFSRSLAEPLRRKGLLGDRLREVLLRAIGRAKRFGISGQDDLTLFARLEILGGPDFDTRHDWARAILVDVGLTGAEKADLLHDAVVFGRRLTLDS